jgi:hypothetical protein
MVNFNIFSDILDDVIKNRPLDYQLPLFINLEGNECPVRRIYRNYFKVYSPRRVEFLKTEDILFQNI